jgi:hypothetical protein
VTVGIPICSNSRECANTHETHASRFGVRCRRRFSPPGHRHPSSRHVNPRCREGIARERRVDRYYDPSTDQFLSVDPDVSETGQPYAFTGDDPLNATDPTGDIRVCDQGCDVSSVPSNPAQFPPVLLSTFPHTTAKKVGASHSTDNIAGLKGASASLYYAALPHDQGANTQSGCKAGGGGPIACVELPEIATFTTLSYSYGFAHGIRVVQRFRAVTITNEVQMWSNLGSAMSNLVPLDGDPLSTFDPDISPTTDTDSDGGSYFAGGNGYAVPSGYTVYHNGDDIFSSG